MSYTIRAEYSFPLHDWSVELLFNFLRSHNPVITVTDNETIVELSDVGEYDLPSIGSYFLAAGPALVTVTKS